MANTIDDIPTITLKEGISIPIVRPRSVICRGFALFLPSILTPQGPPRNEDQLTFV